MTLGWGGTYCLGWHVRKSGTLGVRFPHLLDAADADPLRVVADGDAGDPFAGGEADRADPVGGGLGDHTVLAVAADRRPVRLGRADQRTFLQ